MYISDPIILNLNETKFLYIFLSIKIYHKWSVLFQNKVCCPQPPFNFPHGHYMTIQKLVSTSEPKNDMNFEYPSCLTCLRIKGHVSVSMTPCKWWCLLQICLYWRSPIQYPSWFMNLNATGPIMSLRTKGPPSMTSSQWIYQ